MALARGLEPSDPIGTSTTNIRLTASHIVRSLVTPRAESTPQNALSEPSDDNVGFKKGNTVDGNFVVQNIEPKFAETLNLS
jgi:hypothetical protein